MRAFLQKLSTALARTGLALFVLASLPGGKAQSLNLELREGETVNAGPFMLGLVSSEEELDESGDVGGWYSELWVHTSDGVSRGISAVGRPMVVGGWRFYQSGWEKKTSGEVVSTLMCVYDPLVPVKSIGLWTLLAAALLMIAGAVTSVGLSREPLPAGESSGDPEGSSMPLPAEESSGDPEGCSMLFPAGETLSSAGAVGDEKAMRGRAVTINFIRIAVVVFGLLFTWIVLDRLGVGQNSLPPVLRSAWFPAHLAAYMCGYAVMATLCIVSVAGVSRPRLDAISGKLLRLGWGLLTCGIVLGSLWAERAWGSFWSWDPKESWALVTWLSYLLCLHLPEPSSRRSRTLRSVLVIISFLFLQMCWWGIGLLPSSTGSLHIYGM